MLALAVCGIMVSSVNAQVKPVQKPVKKDTVKKEAPKTKEVKKEQKSPAAPAKKH